jgi:FkbM family methyltransferase
MPPSLSSLLPASVQVDIVDVGANPIDGAPPYAPLLAAGRGRVIGFEPNMAALSRLQASARPGDLYLPHAVGDGRRVRFRTCQAPGMSSTLPLNEHLMRRFHRFVEWGRVVSETDVDTVRLDDVKEVARLDFLKIDVQGGELAVFEGAREKLRNALCVQTEVMFQDMYVGQPLFADQDQFLRALGFRLHCLLAPMTRCLAPILVRQDPYSGINQLLQADAVYVRDFANLEALDARQLLVLALIANDCYRSPDLAYLALSTHDETHGGDHASRYLSALSGGAPA